MEYATLSTMDWEEINASALIFRNQTLQGNSNPEERNFIFDEYYDEISSVLNMAEDGLAKEDLYFAEYHLALAEKLNADQKLLSRIMG